ncbi:MAG: lysylphosphatidylglycerol synthase transmembrane domain-containing protein [Eubacteriales bacterium]|nr:lysylphosphatidylglycerol synthase transmembrane domain-containing protein [Eubacteriales bacterium]
MTRENENSRPSPGRRKRRHRGLWQIIYIAGTLAIIVLLGTGDPQLKTLFSGQLHLEGKWLWLCAAALAAFWFLQACGYAYLGRIVGAKTTFRTSLRITLYGEYYSAITPFASGGQPIQLAYYLRYGVNAAKASSILAMRYIGYISSVCACYLLSLLTGQGAILTNHPLILWLTIAGFIINALSIVAVGLLLLRASLVETIGYWAIRQLTKLKFLKGKREKWEAAFQKGMVEFSAAARCIRSNPARCLLAFLLLLLSVVCIFSTAYLVYRAMGLSSAAYGELFAMQVFLYLAVAFMPTPGAAGATEGGFYLFFALVFPKSLLYSAMLLWRLFTYYSQLLVGGVLVVAGELAALRDRHIKSKTGSETDASATSGSEKSETTPDN